jgi:hypothetical protein
VLADSVGLALLALTVTAESEISAIEVIGDHERLRRMRFAVLPD